MHSAFPLRPWLVPGDQQAACTASRLLLEGTPE